jgi:hypothetical protein
MEAAENWLRDDSMAIGQVVVVQHHDSIGRRIREPRSPAAMRAANGTQDDAATAA